MQHEPSPPPTPPLRYGRYEVLFRIASGGMAEVFAARIVGEGGFEKMVALKRMLPTLAEDEKFVSMFLDEGRVAANISSPHVVQTLDLGRAEDDSLYLVMELVVGASLGTLLKVTSKNKQRIPVPIAAEIVAQAAQGLHDAHEARTVYGEPLHIVHRDVSPQNVLVDVSGRARITDFGVARALQRISHTQDGEVKGKLAYFAPEQARGKQLDRRADLFALGVVAWETFVGKRLFSGANPAETLTNVLEMPIPRLDAVRPEIPRALADAIAAAVERDPAKRTGTAAELARAVRASCACASSAEIAEFVRSNGGEALMRVEAGLRSASPSSPSGRSVASTQGSAAPAGERSGVMRSGVGRPVVPPEDAPTTVTPSVPAMMARASGAPRESSPVLGVGTGAGGAGASGVARETDASSPGSGTPVVALVAAAPTPAEPSRKNVAWVAVGAIVVLVALVAGAVAWVGTAPEPSVTELPVGGMPVGTAPVRTGSETAAGAAAPGTTTPRSEVAAAEPPVRTDGAEAAGDDPSADDGDEDEGARRGSGPRGRVHGGPRTGGSRGSASSAGAIEPQREPQRSEPQRSEPQREPQRSEPQRSEPQRETARPTPPRETPPRETAPARDTAPARPGALRGLDDFERELGN